MPDVREHLLAQDVLLVEGGSVANLMAVVAEWSASAGAVDLGVLAVLRSARSAGWRVGLLPNATNRLWLDLRRLGLDREFDRVLGTSDLGTAKPDPEVFTLTCRLLGVEPGQCVFVDDSPVNMSSAAGVGLDAHFFPGAGSLAALLGVGAPGEAGAATGGGSTGAGCPVRDAWVSGPSNKVTLVVDGASSPLCRN